ncbi:MAG: bis(5'-nucleosyl)-tetraphosphatase (symmetrical) YqeK [Symbiobacteriaceae bacterium]|nr:bis(5'-nucleosyl)-tetraphosphatase (symmetrical) YqeK [Symbiobacteriaceae bacterium]
MEYAVSLAQVYGTDVSSVRIAALLHDACRDLSMAEMLDRTAKSEYRISEFEYVNPVLLHGPLAAEWAEKDLGIADESILEAIRFHTTGAPGMGKTAMVLFLADALEPLRSFPEAPCLRKRIMKLTLKAAVALTLRYNLHYLIDAGKPISPHSVALHNQLLKNSGDTTL